MVRIMRKLPVLLVLLLGTACWAQERIPIILDTDIGDDIDDALALALALQSPELDVRAVTTVIDDTETRTRLAWKELGLYGRHDIPVVGIGKAKIQVATQLVPAPVHLCSSSDPSTETMDQPVEFRVVARGPARHPDDLQPLGRRGPAAGRGLAARRTQFAGRFHERYLTLSRLAPADADDSKRPVGGAHGPAFRRARSRGIWGGGDLGFGMRRVRRGGASLG